MFEVGEPHGPTRMEHANHPNVGPIGHVCAVRLCVLRSIQTNASPDALTIAQQQREPHVARTLAARFHLSIQTFNRPDKRVFFRSPRRTEGATHLVNPGERFVPDANRSQTLGICRKQRRPIDRQFDCVPEPRVLKPQDRLAQIRRKGRSGFCHRRPSPLDQRVLFPPFDGFDQVLHPLKQRQCGPSRKGNRRVWQGMWIEQRALRAF